MFLSNINLNLLRSFVAACKYENKTKAAVALSISQTAVTQNINTLENQLNVKLFTPLARGVAPTIDAKRLYDLIMQSLLNLDKAMDAIKDLDEQSVGTIRIGCQTHISNNLLPDYLCEFNAKYPKIKLKINNLPKDINIDLLSKRELDLVIATSLDAKDYPQFKIVDLRNFSNIFFSSRDFIKKNNISDILTANELERLPLVLQFTNFKPIKNLLETLQGKNLNIKTEVASMGLVYHMIQRGSGIGYCFDEFLDNMNNSNIVKLKTDFELPKSLLSCAFAKYEVSKPILAFVNGLKDFYEHQ